MARHRTRRLAAPGEVVDPADVRAVALGAGLAAVGVAPAEAWPEVRRSMEVRVEQGLTSSMRFTYADPARASDPRTALPDARAVLVGALGYRRRPPADVPSGPRGRVAAYAWEPTTDALRLALREVAEHLRAEGWRARVLADDNALVDRAAAHRAGLGWYGKNANLLLPEAGSWFVLGGVVTSAPLAVAPEPLPAADHGGAGEPGGRVGERACGPCRRCLDGCPTAAITAPGVVDAGRCLAWLLQLDGDFPREHREALGDRLYGCDDCQEVCPPNRRRDEGAPAAGSDAVATVDLLELLDLPGDELLARHGSWYVPRRDPDHLRRNALVVLANVADPEDERVRAALRRHLGHPDARLRRHAAWACRRLGLSELAATHAGDDAIAAELALPPPAPSPAARRRGARLGA